VLDPGFGPDDDLRHRPEPGGRMRDSLFWEMIMPDEPDDTEAAEDANVDVAETFEEGVEPANIITKFQAVAAAGTQVISTDIPQGMLGHFADLGAKIRELPIVKLNFVPPEFDVVNPDFAYIQERVAEATAPADTGG